MPRLRGYTPTKGGMVEYQFQRRQELQIAPETTGKGVRTAGIGSVGNRHHLNLTRPLRASKANPLLDGPVGLRDRQIVQLAMAGNSADKIAWALEIGISDVIHSLDKFGLR